MNRARYLKELSRKYIYPAVFLCVLLFLCCGCARLQEDSAVISAIPESLPENLTQKLKGSVRLPAGALEPSFPARVVSPCAMAEILSGGGFEVELYRGIGQLLIVGNAATQAPVLMAIMRGGCDDTSTVSVRAGERNEAETTENSAVIDVFTTVATIALLFSIDSVKKESLPAVYSGYLKNPELRALGRELEKKYGTGKFEALYEAGFLSRIALISGGMSDSWRGCSTYSSGDSLEVEAAFTGNGVKISFKNSCAVPVLAKIYSGPAFRRYSGEHHIPGATFKKLAGSTVSSIELNRVSPPFKISFESLRDSCMEETGENFLSRVLIERILSYFALLNSPAINPDLELLLDVSKRLSTVSTLSSLRNAINSGSVPEISYELSSLLSSRNFSEQLLLLYSRKRPVSLLWTLSVSSLLAKTVFTGSAEIENFWRKKFFPPPLYITRTLEICPGASLPESVTVKIVEDSRGKRLEWTPAGAEDFSHYGVFRMGGPSLESAETLEATIEDRMTSTFNLSDIGGGGYIRVDVFNKKGFSAPSNIIALGEGVTSSNEVTLSFSREGGKTVFLEWTPYRGPNFAAYRIYYSPDSSFERPYLAKTINDPFAGTFLLEGLLSDRRYWVRLAIERTTGERKWSNTVSFRTLQYAADPVRLRIKTLRSISALTAYLEWEKSWDGDFQAYYLYGRPADAGDRRDLLPGQPGLVTSPDGVVFSAERDLIVRIEDRDVNEYEVKNLIPSTRYIFALAHRNSFRATFSESFELETVKELYGRSVRITSEPLGAGEPSWSDDGAYILFSSYTAPDGVLSELSRGTPLTVSPPVPLTAFGAMSGMPFQQGEKIFFLYRNGLEEGIFSIPFASSAKPAMMVRGKYSFYRISPDGRKLFLIMNADGFRAAVREIESGITRNIEGNVTGGVWNNDSASLVISESAGPTTLFSLLDDAGGEKKLLFKVEGNARVSSVSRDGRVLFTLKKENGDRDVKMFAGENRIFSIASSTADEKDAVFSPDGRYITLVSNESGMDQIHLIAVNE